MERKSMTEINLKDRARIVSTERKIRKIVPIIMSLIAGLTSLIYVASVMYSQFGDFTISVNKFNYVEYGLSLSETRDFAVPTASLNCRASEVITNITGSSLDKVDLGAVDGEDNGDNYLCYTFYCKNAGEKSVSFSYAINILEATMDIDKAVRIRVITSLNGGSKTQTDYARMSSIQDENGNYLPEEGTTPFVTNKNVFDIRQDGFAPNDVMKYTIVIWLQGDDLECVDEAIGGEFKIEMKFNILGGAE